MATSSSSAAGVDPNTQRRHHKKVEEYEERPKYRQGRREKAVKVYTVNMESRYLLVMNVPALGATKSLLEQMALYGEIEEYRILYEYPCEEFTEVYWVKYRALDAARSARRKMDGRPFFSNCLHVCYAPEFESVEETREKLEQRRQALARRARHMCSKYTKAARPAMTHSPASSETETKDSYSSNQQCTRSPPVGVDHGSPTVTLGLLPLPHPPGCTPHPPPHPPESTPHPPPHPPSSAPSQPHPSANNQTPYPSMVPRDMTAPHHSTTTAPVRPAYGGLSLEERLSLHQAYLGGPKVHEKEERAKDVPAHHSGTSQQRGAGEGGARWKGGLGQGGGLKQGGEPGQGGGLRQGGGPGQGGGLKQEGGTGQIYFSYYEPPVPEEGVGQQPQKSQSDQLLSGSSSVERSVLRVRQQMRKVMEHSGGVASSVGPQKKRKRI